ncbi:hypothetical protein FSP39_024422 [Pinctada imbricata]|uniref:Acylphosphatase-like domain-containing protein n=1 Tax=Pinctada imbricata TaxID=66713 RepID=A0AA88XX91_PINIB|nr:hypothetical protein FSP39_024422 [Pinctada imbricata]
MSDCRFLSVDFEISGKVQGIVQVTAYAFEEAKKVGAVGWMMNTERGTLKGTIQGTSSQVNHMKEFFGTYVSPYCTVTQADFQNEHELVHREYPQFTVRPTDW